MDVQKELLEETQVLQWLDLPDDIISISVSEVFSSQLNCVLESQGYYTLGDILKLNDDDINSLNDINEDLLTELTETTCNIKRQIIDYFLRIGRGEFIEGDMQIYDSESNDGYENKIFKRNPLIGNKVINKENTKKLHECLQIYIDDFFNGRSPSNFSLKAKMQITLAIINLAKEWDSHDETSFWRYITLNTGYRDRSEKLRDFFCKCIHDAISEGNRWFIKTETGYQYKSTLVTHAMTPKKSWFAFYDLLFDFYKDVLNWNFKKNEPIISKMIRELKNRIINSDFTDVNLEVSGKIYEIREGIRKLIMYRTNYSNKLVNDMLERIDKVLNKENLSQSDYLSILCNEWYKYRLDDIDNSTAYEGRASANRNIALDYNRIKPVYEFRDYKDLVLTLPEVRLEKVDFEKITVKLYISDVLVDEETLPFYGNELGKTIKENSLSLTRYLETVIKSFDIRVVISCDDEYIYDSKQNLYRKWICFKNQYEITPSRCQANIPYHLFIPKDKHFSVQNYEEHSLAEEYKYINCYYLNLLPNYIILSDEGIIARDNKSFIDKQIIYPNIVQEAEYIKEGEIYQILKEESCIRLLLDEEESKCYAVKMNSQIIDDFIKDDSGGESLYRVPLVWDDDNCCNVNIYDYSKKRIISSKNYILIPDFNVRYSKEILFSIEDYDKAFVEISSSNLKKIVKPIYKDDETVAFPLSTGNIEVKIPIITTTSSNDIAWSNIFYAWKRNIKQDEVLIVNHPMGYTSKLYLGEYEIKNRRGKFYLGNEIMSLSDDCNDWIEVKLKITINSSNITNSYVIGHISTRERFRDSIRFYYQDNALCWNKGGEFIGDKDKNLKLEILSSEEDVLCTYPLDLKNDVIIQNPSLEIGEYEYNVILEGDDIFEELITLDSGEDLPIGDINERRFKDKLIKIKYVTNDADNDKDESKRWEIKNTYIDNIKYYGVENIEGKECAIYRGIMFYYNTSNNTRCEFSYVDDDERYKVNPVKIICIDNRLLSIMNEDSGGLYYYRYYDTKGNWPKNIYYITDKEPYNSNVKDSDKYSIADLYIYETERI